MNRLSFLIKNNMRGALNAVAESIVADRSLSRLAALLGGQLALLPAAMVCAAPLGGQVSAGSGDITQNGKTTTIQQTSDRLAINWNSFNVAPNESVRFNQPNANAIVLNRVLGQNRSSIHGSVSANGQVFILNPNGVLFGSGAQVNVGGLVASTLNLSDSDFMNGDGRYVFSGTGRAGAQVINLGTINANGGYIALLAPQVINRGTLTAHRGNVSLAAGTQMTLTLASHSLLTLSIDQGAVDALVENSHLIQADGGVVVLSSKGKDGVLSGVVNNSGVIQARRVSNQGGEIRLLAHGGTVKVGGTLDASAGDGGDGGSIETAGDQVEIADSAQITTAAANGKTGTWKIDANDFLVANQGGHISGGTLSRMLALNNVGINTHADNGDIVVNDALNWRTATRLSLKSKHDIKLNGGIDTANGDLALNAGKEISAPAAVRVNQFALDGGKWIQNSATLAAFSAQDFRLNAGSFLRMAGGEGTGGNPYRIADVYGLQGIRSSRELLRGSYRLINHIDASGTAKWNDGAGFVPIGDGYDKADWGNGDGFARGGESHGAFTGDLDGQDYTVSNMHINRPQQISVGMIGFVDGEGKIRRMRMAGGRIVGGAEVGALVGSLWHGTVSDSISSADVFDSPYAFEKHGHRNNAVGGLVGGNFQGGTISRSHAIGAVSGSGGVGGLVGMNDGTIENSHARGKVDGKRNVGGLAGVSVGQIHTASATGAVSGETNVGGLVGISRISRKRPGANENGRQISNVYATGNVNGDSNVGGLIGSIENGAQIHNTRAGGAVSGKTNVGGLVGKIDTAGAAISNSYWDTQISGQSNSAGGEGRTTVELRDMGFASLMTGTSSLVNPPPLVSMPSSVNSPASGNTPPLVNPPPSGNKPSLSNPLPSGNQPPSGNPSPPGNTPPAGNLPPAVATGIMHSINAVRTARLTALIAPVPPVNIADLITVTGFSPEIAVDENFRFCDSNQGKLSLACGVERTRAGS